MGLKLLSNNEITKSSTNAVLITATSTASSSTFLTEMLPKPKEYDRFHDTGIVKLTPNLPLTSSIETVDSINVKLVAVYNTIEEIRLMKVLDIQKFIHSIYSNIDNVLAVYLFDRNGYLEINTIIDTKDRSVRSNIFNNQIRIHEKYPDLLFDFKIIIKNDETIEELEPNRASICYKK